MEQKDEPKSRFKLSISVVIRLWFEETFYFQTLPASAPEYSKQERTPQGRQHGITGSSLCPSTEHVPVMTSPVVIQGVQQSKGKKAVPLQAMGTLGREEVYLLLIHDLIIWG
jgi:hypothetical protein